MLHGADPDRYILVVKGANPYATRHLVATREQTQVGWVLAKENKLSLRFGLVSPSRINVLDLLQTPYLHTQARASCCTAPTPTRRSRATTPTGSRRSARSCDGMSRNMISCHVLCCPATPPTGSRRSARRGCTLGVVLPKLISRWHHTVVCDMSRKGTAALGVVRDGHYYWPLLAVVDRGWLLLARRGCTGSGAARPSTCPRSSR